MLYVILCTTLLTALLGLSYGQGTQYDCLEGSSACQSAVSIIYVGSTVQCCQDGDSISSVTTGGYNSATGQTQRTCRCSKNGGIVISSGGTVVSNGGGIINGRPMTDAEKQEFTKEMNAWSTDFTNSMSAWSQSLTDSLSNMFNGNFLGKK